MDSDESLQPSAGESAGHQLRMAREKLGLSQSDIADSQHLRVSVIQFIEEADYGQIDSELFLKGYVRAYAKQVGVDADHVIQTLDQELEPLRKHKALQAEENPLVYIERRKTKKRRIAKVLFSILILAALMFAGWTYIVEPRLAQPSDSAGEPGPDTALPAGAADSDDEPWDVNSDTRAALSDSQGESIEATTANPSSSDEPVTVEPLQSVESALSRATAVSPEEALVTDPVPEAGQPAPQAEVGLAESEPAPEDGGSFVTPQAELEMSFIANCWVQVTDSSGNQMVASLQREGDQLNIAGEAPFRVVIGAVDAVETVSFSGEQVDLSSFAITNNRAEFTLTL